MIARPRGSNGLTGFNSILTIKDDVLLDGDADSKATTSVAEKRTVEEDIGFRKVRAAQEFDKMLPRRYPKHPSDVRKMDLQDISNSIPNKYPTFLAMDSDMTEEFSSDLESIERTVALWRCHQKFRLCGSEITFFMNLLNLTDVQMARKARMHYNDFAMARRHGGVGREAERHIRKLVTRRIGYQPNINVLEHMADYNMERFYDWPTAHDPVAVIIYLDRSMYRYGRRNKYDHDLQFHATKK